MKLKRIISGALLGVWLLSGLAAQASVLDYIPTVTIENSGENRYKIVKLPALIYNHARSDLADLRLRDASGEEVPYSLNSLSDLKITTLEEEEQFYSEYTESLAPSFAVETPEDEAKRTYVYINGLKNLRLASITIETDSTFQRQVHSSLGSKELFNLPFLEEGGVDTTLNFLGYRNIPNDTIFTLTIENGDDKPIDIGRITVVYYVDELIFEDTGSSIYTLRCGSGNTAPVYDSDNYIEQIREAGVGFDRLEISKITFAEADMPIVSEEDDSCYLVLFNIVIVAVALLLGVVILLRLRKK
jgi:hypothetical protein